MDLKNQGDSNASLLSEPPDRSENVRVMVRLKPLGPKETSCVEISEPESCIEVDGRQFFYDAVFGLNLEEGRIYLKSAHPLVEAAFNGYNSTIFLYGQTGTGKTYTHSSLALSSFAHLFNLIGSSGAKTRFLIRASYYELYNEEIHDLLAQQSSKPLELRESIERGVYIKDLTCYLVDSPKECERLKQLGDKQRATAATNMNEYSSRSHSIFSLTIEAYNEASTAVSKVNSSNKGRNFDSNDKAKSRSKKGEEAVRVGHLNMIDLAGSERQSKSGSSGIRLKEASRINLSLTCLSLVIRALTDKSSQHIPYRNSKLTRILSNSLGGNSKTLLIACVSGSKRNMDETLNTLRFASRTKRIKNKARINEDTKDALLRKYRRQLEELRKQLLDKQNQQQSRTMGGYIDADPNGDELEALMNGLISGDMANDIVGGDQTVLLQQLRLLKAKIIVGGENLLEKAEAHERLLEASRLELEEKRRREEELKNQLEAKRENLERIVQRKDGLEGQVCDLDEKLKRVLMIYKQTKDELRDLISEHGQLKESLLLSIRATSKEIRMTDAIVGNFIPSDYLNLINTYAQYDDESDEWQIKYIALSGANVAQNKNMGASQDIRNSPALNIRDQQNRFHSQENNSKIDAAIAGNINIDRSYPLLRLRELIK